MITHQQNCVSSKVDVGLVLSQKKWLHVLDAHNTVLFANGMLRRGQGLGTDEELRTGTVPYRVCMQIILYLQKVLLNFFFLSGVSPQEQNNEKRATRNLSLRSRLKQLRFIGRMVGFSIFENLLLDLHLSKPFVKQVTFRSVFTYYCLSFSCLDSYSPYELL